MIDPKQVDAARRSVVKYLAGERDEPSVAGLDLLERADPRFLASLGDLALRGGRGDPPGNCLSPELLSALAPVPPQSAAALYPAAAAHGAECSLCRTEILALRSVISEEGPAWDQLARELAG